MRLSVHRGGAGDPVMLLHGYPQNHMTWAAVAPRLAQSFDVIVPDLRGYGDSDAPPDDAAHTTYSKRTMARDIVGLMDALGLERAHVIGHDRGARVAYRLALDHPARVARLGICRSGAHGRFLGSVERRARHGSLSLDLSRPARPCRSG
jgi:haloacetate dehalogenase